MYNSKRRLVEEVPTALTTIWNCSNDSCNGWMRDNFAFASIPTCPQCNSMMEKDEKVLDVVENNSPVTAKRM